MRDFHPLVMLAHGINTHGHWQKVCAEVFNDANIVHRTFDRYVSVPAFLLPWRREWMIAEFLQWYGAQLRERQLDPRDPYQRPSIVAHSFGTWFVARCMLKHPEVRFHKLILLGGILPPDFPWYELFLRDQVHTVTNECGWGDTWAGWVRRAVPHTGPSGRDGFRQRDESGLVDRHYEEFAHSDYFYKEHMAAWVQAVSQSPPDLRVLHGAEIAKNYADMLDLTHEMDVENFKVDPAFVQADLPRGLAVKWIAINPDLYTFLVDHAGHPRAYINAMPLTRQAYKRVKEGQRDDNEIEDIDVLPYLAGSEIDIYLMSIGIDKTVRRENDGLFSPSLHKLVNAFVGKLVIYARDHGILVRRLLAVGWTTQGKKLCTQLGMKPTGGTDKHGHPIYELDLRTGDGLGKGRLFAGMRKLVAVMQKR